MLSLFVCLSRFCVYLISAKVLKCMKNKFERIENKRKEINCIVKSGKEPSRSSLIWRNTQAIHSVSNFQKIHSLRLRKQKVCIYEIPIRQLHVFVFFCNKETSSFGVHLKFHNKIEFIVKVYLAALPCKAKFYSNFSICIVYIVRNEHQKWLFYYSEIGSGMPCTFKMSKSYSLLIIWKFRLSYKPRQKNERKISQINPDVDCICISTKTILKHKSKWREV